MILTLDVSDEQVAALQAQAQARGISTEQLAAQILADGLAQSAGDGGVVERMRALRARVTPDPDGWTIRDYIDHGRR